MRFMHVAFVGLLTTTYAGSCPYAKTAKADDRVRTVRSDARPATGSFVKSERGNATSDQLGVMFMNRIAPSGAQLWIANANGSNAVKLMGNQTAPFDYHARWSASGEWIVFTTERRADGQSDIYRIRPNGEDLEPLVHSDSFEDSGSLSPDGSTLAYVSTAINYTSNIFVKDLLTGKATNITGGDATVASFVGPHSFYRPTWSPDGQWLAFSSDVGTQWTGHSNGTGWEHTQELAVYIIRPNGSDFRKIVSQETYSLGAPQWSPDGERLVYYNITTEDTYDAHGTSDEEETVVSQIFSVDVASGLDVTQHTFDDSLKVSGHFIGNSTQIVGYLVKAGTDQGINYTPPSSAFAYFNTSLRNPSWSPDGTKVVYEVYEWEQRQAEKELFSWDSQWAYRFMDVFPQYHIPSGRLATTEKQLGNASSSVVTTYANYSDLSTILDVYELNSTAAETILYKSGLAGAFQPSWKPDGSQIAVGYGAWFFERTSYPATLYLADVDSTDDGLLYQNLTDGTLNAGFPSFSPDGTKIVYRLWNWEKGPLGLHILDLTNGETTRLTWGWDNTPGWSPDGELIVFTRQTNWTTSYGPRWYEDRFDICTIRPDGTDLKILTESEANDAHAVWSPDGRILYNSGMYGFRDESALYDNTFQPYGQIIVMNADGTNKTMLTDSMWEDSMPMYVRYLD